MNKEMEFVRQVQKDVTLLGQTSALLGWDEETYMPEKGIYSRAEQVALVSKIAHAKVTSDKFFFAIEKLRKLKIAGKEGIMIEKLHKDVLRARKLPSEFVHELARQATLAGSAWREARKKNNFKIFQKNLEKLVELKRKEADYIGLPGHLYNGLLDEYEEGMTAEKLKKVFYKLKLELVELIRKIESSDKYSKRKKEVSKGKYDRESMNKFIHDFLSRIGMKDDSSRVDLSEHPFTTKIGINDVRITTNFRKNPMFSFSSAIHEAGHALYELNLPEEDAYNILGDAPSLGMHESQSRFWENMIGKGKHFWKFYYPKFKKEFKLKGNMEDWYKELNAVYPEKIRIESDEVHYCLHIILRFEIELGLLDGTIKVADLPGIWNAKIKRLFKVDVKNDVEGVLQDVHWSMGSFGYFPTYAIGSIYSAQIYNALKRERKNVEKEIEKGNFMKISAWLKEKVHNYGSEYFAEDIVKKVCGEGLNPDFYIKYLNDKYGEIYGF